MLLLSYLSYVCRLLALVFRFAPVLGGGLLWHTCLSFRSLFWRCRENPKAICGLRSSTGHQHPQHLVRFFVVSVELKGRCARGLTSEHRRKEVERSHRRRGPHDDAGTPPEV